MGVVLAAEPSVPVEKPKVGEFVWNELATNIGFYRFLTHFFHTVC